MACCGKQRRQLGDQLTHVDSSTAGSDPRLSSEKKTAVLFEYVGSSQLSIRGLTTGKQYLFSKPGSVVEVDEGDRSMLTAIPGLRQL
jgi:hypothetical protein